MADEISKIKLPNNTEYDIKDSIARLTASAAIPSSTKGIANGVAELDSNGLVPASQLPSYVDDVFEYTSKSQFPVTGETGKIYVATDTNLTYRWSGTAYVEISPSLALGETSSTAYRGDRGKTAYNHSQVTSGNPHNVTKSDVGLGNVGNFKAVSTVASQELTSTEQSNARANIGAGTGDGTVTSITLKATSPIAIDSSSAITTSGTRTLSHANSGVTAGTYRSVTVNATGHVTAGTNPTTLSGYGITDAKITNGVITLGSNTITPLTSHQTVTDNNPTLAWGTKSKVATIGSTAINVTMPSNPNTDTKVTAVGNHYTPAEDSTAQLDADASSTTAATWNSTSLVTGITVKRDAKGHVTGIAVDSIKMPANPNTNTTYTIGTSGNNITLTPSSGSAQSITAPYATSAGSATKATQDGSGNTITSTYVKKSGDTMTGTLTLYKEGTTAQNYPTELKFQNKDTTTGKTSTGYIRAYDGGDSGANLVICPQGNMFIGSGEAAQNHYNLYTHNTSENFYATADGNMFLQANGQTIANRVGMGIYNDHTILPVKADTKTNNVGSIGTSSYKWNAMYATTFYGTLSGNATSAATLTTARNIALGNDFQGSANFDGSGNVTIEAMQYNCRANGGNKANYPWHRIAYVKDVTGTWNDKEAILVIRRGYIDGDFGIIKISLRTNESGAACSVNARWIVRYGFAATDVVIAHWGTTGSNVYADVFLKCGTYPRTTIYQMCGSRSWILINSIEFNNTTTTDKKTSTEVYVTVASAATEIHNQAYTSTINATDSGTVNYANSAGSATTASKLSTNAGSATNPVYFTSGVPTACTYSLNKSVPSDAKFTDTNTHRPIQVDGTEILGNNTTALNLKAGNNVTITHDGGAVTIASSYTNTDVNVKVNNTNSTTGTWYFPVWYTDTSGTGNVNANDGFLYYSIQGTASAAGRSILRLGNGTQTGTAGNKYGELRIYSQKQGYSELTMASGATAERKHTLPDVAGTIGVFTATPTSGQVVVSDGTAGGFKTTGYTIAKSVPSNAVFTDTNDAVTQTKTTTNANYDILFSVSTSGTDTKTEGARKSDKIKFNPSQQTLTIGSGNDESVISNVDIKAKQYELRSPDKTLLVKMKLDNTGQTAILAEDSEGTMLWYNNYINSDGTLQWNNPITCSEAFSCASFLSGQIELKQASPYIDFHHNNSTADFTSRIITTNLAELTFYGKNSSGTTVYGTCRGAAFTVISSKYMKENIKDIEDDEAKKLLQLRPVSFDYKYTGETNKRGLIAEEVLDVMPEMVYVPEDYSEPVNDEIPDNVPSIDYSKFVPYLIKMVQIQQKEIDELKFKAKD